MLNRTYDADKENKAKKRLTKIQQKVASEASQELRQLDIDARNSGFSKEKARRRKQDIYRAMRKDGIL